jgi:UDP-N-acetylglucosamine--N-acetylmuramyl-(pentapeptide) pyrophosphoryl-undecaprenol N-acetylglucosamine transferase
MKPYKFILSGGGTGGHIYPAIAIANELKLRFPDAEFFYL